jgi:hypothetical protein
LAPAPLYATAKPAGDKQKRKYFKARIKYKCLQRTDVSYCCCDSKLIRSQGSAFCHFLFLDEKKVTKEKSRKERNSPFLSLFVD